MKSHRVPAIGRPAPLRGFAGDGDLVIAVARLIADRGAGASLAGQAVAHSVARGFAFNRKLELPATAGGMACHCAAPSYMGSPSPNELVTLRWEAIDFAHGQIHVSRAKNGSPSVHPRRHRAAGAAPPQARPGAAVAVRVHVRARRALYHCGVRKMMARLGVAAKLGFKAHPHMLRHACGFQLANQGTDTRTLQAYLGHRNIQHTVRYTELSPTRFKNLWRD